ncbi:hypothetical protein FOA52_002209 [Chlamydomonas sp. UWO 241]|nr:hypothetical protein FOA52_002209 [Chlamydomonas sp. UWO 241]
MRTLALRLRLEFAADLVTPNMTQMGLHKCWYEPLDTAETIGELAQELVERFMLEVERVSDLVLSTGGFTLPQNSQVSLLRDGDIVAITGPGIVGAGLRLAPYAGMSGMGRTATHGLSVGGTHGSGGAEHSAGEGSDDAEDSHRSGREGAAAGGQGGWQRGLVPGRGRAEPEQGGGGGSGGAGPSRFRGNAAEGRGSAGNLFGVDAVRAPSGTRRAAFGAARRSDQSIPCLVCRSVLGKKQQVKASLMREHIGHHILIGDIPTSACGFCGQVGDCHSYLDRGSKRSIVPVSSCAYFYKFSVKVTQQAHGKCSNLPMLCSACMTPTYVWKYHMERHWEAVHPDLTQAGQMPKEYTLSELERSNISNLKPKSKKKRKMDGSTDGTGGAGGTDDAGDAGTDAGCTHGADDGMGAGTEGAQPGAAGTDGTDGGEGAEDGTGAGTEGSQHGAEGTGGTDDASDVGTDGTEGGEGPGTAGTGDIAGGDGTSGAEGGTAGLRPGGNAGDTVGADAESAGLPGGEGRPHGGGGGRGGGGAAAGSSGRSDGGAQVRRQAGSGAGGSSGGTADDGDPEATLPRKRARIGERGAFASPALPRAPVQEQAQAQAQGLEQPQPQPAQGGLAAQGGPAAPSPHAPLQSPHTQAQAAQGQEQLGQEVAQAQGPEQPEALMSPHGSGGSNEGVVRGGNNDVLPMGGVQRAAVQRPAAAGGDVRRFPQQQLGRGGGCSG